MDHVRQAGRTRKPVYAVYVVAPDPRLVRVVSLRELLSAEPGTPITDVGEHRHLVAVKPTTDREEASHLLAIGRRLHGHQVPMLDREEVARLLSKYNLLAVPV